ncbi:MAG: response regulator transcription factor [Chloroflexota bacterium]|jgi:DNA-binding NarL/FixJ family response regulator
MRPSVLMVDDHDVFRTRARAMLEAHGFDVIGEASDGRTAVAAADRLRPDIALVDIGLPDIDGFAVAAMIRAAGTARRIVLISGREAADYGGRMASSAADGFIPKGDLSGESLHAMFGS